ncbi:MAG: hypothetical protein RRC34_07375 [Lentisphaeria bacterium]|nr:hypothetical protein [Lentisphaeria bacterium]
MMKAHVMKNVCGAIAAVVIGTSSVWAAKPKTPAPKAPLSETGQRLEARYAEQLETLKQEIVKALPTVDDQKKAAYMQARDTETAAEAELNEAGKLLGAIKAAQGAVGHAKGKWIGGAEKGIAETEAKLKKAATEAEREALMQELAKWRQNKEDGLAALKERQAKLDAALANEPAWRARQEAAETALAQARAQTLKRLNDLNLDAFLASGELDDKLAAFVVLYEATPYGLAAFAQQGEEHETLIENLLADADLMTRMLVADGASGGDYGQAMKIYTDIQKASDKAKDGVLERLALAVSLEHAVPIGQRNATDDPDAPKTVDPVARYLSYEKAYVDGELDPGFKDLSVWDYRLVVDGEEPDEISAWGRQMLRDYRPDHIATDDYRWRYVAAVRTEVRYGSQYNKYDKPELQFFQNILMNGGVCGRRAFFGRFILRAFGIPTTARPQPGHAALAHWTPDGWVVNLGGGWGSGTTKLQYTDDRDFLATTQARENEKAFMAVKRAQWVGDVLGENRIFGLHDKAKPGFWYGVSLYTQRNIIEESKAVALAAVGEELGEANETEVKPPVDQVALEARDKTITVSPAGVITMPAAACSEPTKSTGKIIFMDSFSGGKQLHYSRVGSPQDFEYTVTAPTAGKYMITARIANPSWGQNLLVAVNGAKEPTEIKLPLTTGLWDNTQPVEIQLAEGENVLRFSRSGENIRGLSIKEFTLAPVAK